MRPRIYVLLFAHARARNHAICVCHGTSEDNGNVRETPKGVRETPKGVRETPKERKTERRQNLRSHKLTLRALLHSVPVGAIPNVHKRR